MTEQNKLVLRINELFHDFEQINYDKKHTDIFIGESGRWKNTGKIILKNRPSPISIVDIGCGTGFVPMQICDLLQAQDTFICSDISEKMLAVCKEKIAQRKFLCDFKFIKSDGFSLNLKDESIDVVTMNSVLHHIPDFTPFFNEINRILKVDGLLIIGHEPNSLFFKNSFLWYNHRIIFLLVNPAQLIISIFGKTGLFKIMQRIYRKINTKNSDYQKIVQKINTCLLNEGLVHENLSYEKIMELIDIQSPTAGKISKEKKGIDIASIPKKYLDNFKIEIIETYNHIPRINNKNILIKKYSDILRRVFPDKGATFFVVLKKYK
ncbi:MAG: class I SAM-dependent methyltransferase [Parcubacteria group bacterium]